MKVLVVGSGPIVVGQAAEFDYAGVQVCRQLKKENIEVVLVNSNPATIMTDSNVADKIYIEPITAYFLEKIIKKEKPDAMLASFGGQTSLNIACELYDKGILDKYNVKLLGTDIVSIKNSEDRLKFKKLMQNIGEPVLDSGAVSDIENACAEVQKIGYPVILRPAFTLGGYGNAIVESEDDLKLKFKKGIQISPISQVLIEKSVYGFKEIELEIVRDKNNNCILVCSMENVDSMGIHTGDSIVVAPAQTLSQNLFVKLRESAFKIACALQIVGSCNIQYAVNPKNEDEYYVIEVNPRVSRSSALASKATGFPIAKVATKLALDYLLSDFSDNLADIEPKLDYITAKFPKFSFDKFKNINRTLTTHMKSTGEVMAIGKTLEEAFYKGLQSLEMKFNITDSDFSIVDDLRIFRILNALKNGVSEEEIAQTTKIDCYFIKKLKNLVSVNMRSSEDYFYKICPYCDGNAPNSYFYSSKYKFDDNISINSNNKKILVIGSGPIRIGQGIEFDYCCVHAVNAIKELGYDAVLLNSNPETLSTDYDVSTRLYFEPVTSEYVRKVIEFEKPDGIIVQFGGQTAINVLDSIKQYNILGTSPEAVNITEDRILFNQFLKRINIPQPKNYNKDNMVFPVTVRPSYVIGGFGVQIAYNQSQFSEIMEKASGISSQVIIDEYIDGLECEADIISDGENILVAGFMEHIERAGIHSGDSIAVYPSKKITNSQKQQMYEYSLLICKSLNIRGLINIQFIIKNNEIYVIEVNPRASRTIPVLSKMTGYPVCKTAIKVILGGKLDRTGILEETNAVSVKMPIFSFNQLRCDDTVLTTEMKSTGEVLGVDDSYENALLKAFIMSDTNFSEEQSFLSYDTEKAYLYAINLQREITHLGVNTINNYVKRSINYEKK